MAVRFSRRTVLNLRVGAAALSLGARSSSSGACESASGPEGCALPAPAEAPFDTVVVLMMENRSFDHVLGWLPGANDRQNNKYIKGNAAEGLLDLARRSLVPRRPDAIINMDSPGGKIHYCFHNQKIICVVLPASM